MKIIIGIALVVLVALLGAHRSFTKIRLPLIARHIYLTGSEFILVGLCFGSQLLGILDAQTIKNLGPLLYLAFGWIGFLCGVQLETAQIAQYPRQYSLLALAQAVGTLLLCFLPSLYFIRYAETLNADQVLIGALALGAIAIPSAPPSQTLLPQKPFSRRSAPQDLLSYTAGIDTLVGLAGFGLLFSYAKAITIPGPGVLIGFQYLGLSIGFGVLMGLLVHLLTRRRCSQQELVLYVIGAVVFTAGACALIGISSLFTTAVAGFVIANTRGAKVRILQVLAGLEKPLYIIVLIFAGAMLSLQQRWTLILLLAAIYIILRTAGKLGGGWLMRVGLPTSLRPPPLFGLGAIAPGGMAVAMTVNFHHTFEGTTGGGLLMLMLIAIIVNELISPAVARCITEKSL